MVLLRKLQINHSFVAFNIFLLFTSFNEAEGKTYLNCESHMRREMPNIKAIAILPFTVN